MPNTADLNLPIPTPYQERAIFSPARYVVIEATTKAGKTIGCLWWLLYEACKGTGHREFWWVAPIVDQARIAFDRCRNLIEQADPKRGLLASVGLADKSILLTNGSILRFKSSDNPDHLYGEDVYAAVIDEASRCKEQAWPAVRSTLTATRGKLRVIGNVNGRHNWAFELARRAESGSLPGWEYHRITCHDAVKAKIISTEAVEEARQVLPAHVFRELYEGVPSDDGSNPFGLGHIAACVDASGGGSVVVYGLDLARSTDWTVLVGLDSGGRAVVFDRWQHVPWSETCDRIVGIIGDVATLADSTGVGDAVVDTLQRRCHAVEGFKFTSVSKQQLMEGLAVAIQQRKVTFPDGPIRQELESFECEITRTGVRYSAPDGMHDDCVMALALAVRKLTTQEVPVVSVIGRRPETSGSIRSDFARMRAEDEDFGFVATNGKHH